MDAVVAAPWLTITWLLFFTAWEVSRAFFPLDDAAQHAVNALVLSWAAVVASAIALGAAGVLGKWPLLASVACLCLAALLAFRAVPPVAASRATAPPGLADIGWLAIWVAVAAAGIGHVIYNGLLRFPGDWDTLGYHLPLIDCWLQAGRLHVPHFSHWFNPGNNELLGLWCVAPFSGDFLISLNNLPATLLLALATRQLGVLIGLPRPFAHLAALAAVTNVVVSRQLVDAENDVAVAGLFVASVLYGLRHGRDGRLADLVLASVCLGLLAGVKYYAAGYAALAWLAGAVASLRRGVASGVVRAAVAALAALPWGGYWYLRNVWATGHPFFPKGFTPGDNPFDQLHPNLWQSTLLGNGSPEVLPLALDAVWRMTGPLTFAAVVAAPASAGWLAVSSRLPPRDPAAKELGAGRLALGWLIIGSGLLLAMTPFGAETAPGTLNHLREGYLPARFGACFLTLAILGFAVVLSDARELLATSPRAGQWLAALPLAAMAFAWVTQACWLFSREFEIGLLDQCLFGASAVLLCALALLGRRGWSRRRPVFLRAVTLAVVVAAPWLADALAHRWHAGFAAHYDELYDTKAFGLLAGRDPVGCRLAVLEHRPYPFFGSRRQFFVAHPLLIPQRDRLARYYHAWEVSDVAVVVNDQSRFRDLHGWHVGQPELFSPTLSGGPIAFFRLAR
jgi:hypothetical protein